MHRAYGGDEYRPRRPGSSRRARIILGILLAFILLFAIPGQLITVSLNLSEFGELYLRPLYFTLLGGLVLSMIGLFRLDFAKRRSLTWWGIRFFLRSIRSRGHAEEMPPEYLDFASFKLPPVKFLMWQVTKVLIGTVFLGNLFFGMSLHAMLLGYDFQLGGLLRILTLPFVTLPFDPSYASENVVPTIPALTLLLAPVLAAVGIRLILLVGITQLVKAFSPALSEMGKERPEYRIPVATLEGLFALGLIWTGFNGFFPNQIDFNSKFVVAGTLAAGVVLGAYALLDARRRSLVRLPRRTFYLRFLIVVVVLLAVLSATSIQASIADARKVEWRGPYVAQQIAVNRFLADLDKVEVRQHNFSLQTLPPSEIGAYVNSNMDLLKSVRLWDPNAATAKLRPEVGLLPYVDFTDSDILRFNNSLYWSSSMKPILPRDVRAEDRWYSTHLVYTHVPNGFLLLDGDEGTIVDTARFFQQRRVYYGEGGLLSETWAAYPVGRQETDEVDGYFYPGTGGIDVSPPSSWFFEPNFLLSYPDRTIHLLRYRDVYDRMSVIMPYFQYDFGERKVDIYPVTDGENTYWVMPLIVALDTSHVPWSTGNPFVRLTGYALINTLSGAVKILPIGDDYFTQLFKTLYPDLVTEETPEWLTDQLRYPEEFFEWRMSMFNFYHVSDPATFITAREFYEVPEGLDTYYIVAEPPGFEAPEFVGILSVELRGAAGRNLAGYMVLRNDSPHLGEMIFYRVDIDSPIKLLGPTGVREALERDPEFATLRTLLRDPRVGDNILYRVGEYDVYFIPVYTSGAGGVVAQLGTVAAVGAAFTGDYFVGLASGGTAEEAFANFLVKARGGEAPPPPPPPGDRQMRLSELSQIFEERGLKVVTPQKIAADVEFLEATTAYTTAGQRESATAAVRDFIDRWVAPSQTERIFLWTSESRVNFGALVSVGGVVELHYINIDLG